MNGIAEKCRGTADPVKGIIGKRRKTADGDAGKRRKTSDGDAGKRQGEAAAANGIAEKRREARMTQQDLADALNVDRSTIAKWETGAAFPTGKKLPQVAKVLNCEIDALFPKDEKKGRKRKKRSA